MRPKSGAARGREEEERAVLSDGGRLSKISSVKQNLTGPGKKK